MSGSRIRLKIKASVPSYDMQGSLLPVGNYVFKVSGISSRTITGSINTIEFTFGTRQVLRMVSNQQNVPVSPIRTTRLQRVRNSPPVEETPSPINSNSCPICFSTMRTDRRRLSCRHMFHKTCVDRWLRTNPRCPVCRQRPAHLPSVRRDYGAYVSSHDRVNRRTSVYRHPRLTRNPHSLPSLRR